MKHTKPSSIRCRTLDDNSRHRWTRISLCPTYLWPDEAREVS